MLGPDASQRRCTLVAAADAHRQTCVAHRCLCALCLLPQAHESARAAAEASFYEHLLGRRQAGDLKQQLSAAIAKERKAKVTANVAESNTLCQALEMECTKQLAGLEGRLQVPSMYQFEGRHNACMKRFEVRAAEPKWGGAGRQGVQLLCAVQTDTASVQRSQS